MKLFYTTSTGYNTPQLKVNNSLGGYKSSTLVLNDDFNNLFDEVSIRTITLNRAQYIALILQNDDVHVVNNVETWLESVLTPQCDISIGVVEPTLDADGNPFIQRVENMYSKPTFITFTSPTIETKAYLGNMNPGQELGVWIRRAVNSEVAYKQYNDVAEKDPNDIYSKRYRKISYPKEESWQLNFSFDTTTIFEIPEMDAYQIAKKHGFVGTEEEWLASLKGETGPAPDIDVEMDENGNLLMDIT